jgi:hypothetical protein
MCQNHALGLSALQNFLHFSFTINKCPFIGQFMFISGHKKTKPQTTASVEMGAEIKIRFFVLLERIDALNKKSSALNKLYFGIELTRWF